VDITSKIRSTNDMDSMLRTAVEELRRALGTSHAAVRLNPPTSTAQAAGASQPAQIDTAEAPIIAQSQPTNGNGHAAAHSDTDETDSKPKGGTNGQHRNGKNGANGAHGAEG
jgi:hypothetical protein